MTPTFDMLSSYLIKYSHSKKDVATNWSLYPIGCEVHFSISALNSTPRPFFKFDFLRNELEIFKSRLCIRSSQFFKSDLTKSNLRFQVELDSSSVRAFHP